MNMKLCFGIQNKDLSTEKMCWPNSGVQILGPAGKVGTLEVSPVKVDSAIPVEKYFI